MATPTGVGIHIKTRDRVKVLDAVRAACGAEGLEWKGGGQDADEDSVRFLLLPARGSWVSLYPADPAWADVVAGPIALCVQAPVMIFGRIDDDAFFYMAYDTQGDLLDQFHSCPDWAKDFDEPDASDEELERTRGKPAKVAGLLGASAKAAELKEILHKARIERLRDHDPWDGVADAFTSLRKIGAAFGLPDLEDDFDTLWDLGLEEDEDADLRYLAYGQPEEEKGLRAFLRRLRGRDDDGLGDDDLRKDDDLGDDDDLGKDDDDLSDDDV